MHPQYLPQQAQYGMQPGVGYPPQGYPQQGISPQQQYRPPLNQPQQPQQNFSPLSPPQPGPMPQNDIGGGPRPLTCSLPPQPRGPAPQMHGPPQQLPNQLINQMSGMNINGIQRPQVPQQGPPSQSQMGMPPMKPMVQGYPNMAMGQQMPPTLNGAGPGMHSQLNGLPESSGPGRGGPMQSRYPSMPPMDVQNLAPSGYPGMPPQPAQTYGQQGYPPQPGYPGGPQPSYPGPQAQSRKLDPDQMPSPMQVMDEDRKNKSGIFYTNQRGQVPPLVTTDFIVQDQGNCSPRFIRSTMYSIPITADNIKQTSVPFGLVISPMAEVLEEEQPPPVVDMGELGPVRCLRCKAYMCPNMQFIDGGRRFHCLLCRQTTEVPAEYFQHLDHTGMRVDRFERAELVLGAYDFVATKEYCKENTFPKPPALIFLIDVSYNNIKSGLVSLMCSQMKRFLQNLPKERGQTKSPMRVGFITYNHSVHFYNVNPNLAQPQMLVVGDTQEMFMPLLDGFLVDPIESETVIETLMMQIPSMFADTRETETILAPAIQAGLEALKASKCAGKLFIFHSTLPTAEAPGKLKNRDDRKVLGTEKEKTVLTPQNTIYNNLGQDCVAFGCSIDLFVFNNSYIDLATIGQICRLTGGEVFKYTYFQADLDGERLINDIEKSVSRLCAFDGVMRVRTSTGIRPTDFYGHFFMSNTTDIELACVDPDKSVAIEIKHDDKLSEDEGVFIQAALLYTSISGIRKIRVLNLALKSCSQMADLYRTCELDTIVNFFSKQALYKLTDNPPKGVKENLVSRSAQILACYRKNCASPTSAGQLILPECMKLLPLYINCVLKSDALSGGSDMTVDDRWFTMQAVSIMDIPSSVVYFYPRLLPLIDWEDGMPAPIRCSTEKMDDHGVYLLENGIYMFLWLGLSVASDWVMSVFGVQSVAQVDVEKNRLPVLNNPLSEKIRGLICSICSSRHRSMRLTLVRQRDKIEVVMNHFLVEDRGLDGSSSYVDFLCHMHKEIRTIVS